ncbi:MAG: hypothetical protein JO345_27075 [Streptosporangiaceae bacterium]|nr:hypothetical protein [Streptosporangiaceae bacterium]
MPFTEKLLTSLPPIAAGGRQFKRYYVTSETASISPEIEAAAFETLPKLLPEADGTPAAGFVVLHRGGDGAAYLNAYTWVWDNVLHMRAAAAAQPVLGCPDDDPTHFLVVDRPWIGCVWELPPIQHERDAWVRHMLVPDVADLDGYLADAIPDGWTG